MLAKSFGSKALLRATLAAALLTWPLQALADVPLIAPVQGFLSATGGGPVPDGNYAVMFTLTDKNANGNKLSLEGPVQVAVKNGVFSYDLGTIVPLTQQVLKTPELWLTVLVGTDLMPPVRIAATPLAMRAQTAENVDCSGCIGAAQLDPKLLSAYAKAADLAKVATSGQFSDLQGGPDLVGYAKTSSLSKVATSGLFSDLQGGPDLSAYAKSANLAKVASSGFYTDLVGYPDLSVFAQISALATVATSGNYADLKGAPDLGVYAKAANLANVATTGKYADLVGNPVLPKLGAQCGSGLVLRGIKIDGSYDCVVAMDPKALPPDGIDEISNGLIYNQFVDTSAGSANLAIPDYYPPGVSDIISFPDIGLAQGLTINLDITNSDLSQLAITVTDPANTKFVICGGVDGGGKPYASCGVKGASLKASYPPTATASGDLTAWVGKNPTGKWYLSVTDNSFNNIKNDGQVNAWSISLQTLSTKKIEVKGNLIVDGSVQVGTDNGACTASNAGALRWTGKSFQGCNGNVWVAITGPDGSSQGAAAQDCKAIKAAVPAAGDGIYWIDPNGGSTADAFQVFCDQTTDGGGWTFFAHSNNDYVGGTLFQTSSGNYRTDRVDDGTTYSKGGNILALLNHTSMMVTLDIADPTAAKNSNKIVFYQYTIGHPGFNFGPVPCSGLSNGFSYRTNLTGSFTAGGTSNSCDGGSWYTRTAGNAAYLVLFNGNSTYGNYWGSGMGGNDSWNHDGWWYVR